MNYAHCMHPKAMTVEYEHRYHEGKPPKEKINHAYCSDFREDGNHLGLKQDNCGKSAKYFCGR